MKAEMLILDKHDTMETMLSKLDEEVCEVMFAVKSQTEDEAILETLDVIQVCIGILDHYKGKGHNIAEGIERLNTKLLERGWRYKGVIRIGDD